MVTIPPDSNDTPTISSAAEAPSSGAPAATDGPAKPAAPVDTPTHDTSNQDMPQTAPTGDPQRRRRRRRRRHRRPGTDATTAPPGEISVAAPTVATEASSGTTAEEAAPAQPPTATPRKRRRRRRRPERPGAATAGNPPPGVSGEPALVPAPTEPSEPGVGQTPRHPGRRRRAARDERFGRHDREKQSPERRPGENRSTGTREPRRERDARRPKGPRRERDRTDTRRKPEPKLYRVETIVDRGFEDAPDPTTEDTTRRVDWTISKRTTGDRNTARAVSAIYVLRRDGVETEFPHLSAARAAVNKTISHPEKLTLSKSDHAAAKGAKK